jgi:hypothetical protein
MGVIMNKEPKAGNQQEFKAGNQKNGRGFN